MMARPSPDPVFVLRGSKQPVSCVSFVKEAASASNDSRTLLSGCTGGKVRLWDLSLRRCTSCLDGHHGFGVLAVDSLDSGQIISQGRDGCVHCWDVSEGRQEITSSLIVSTSNFCGFALQNRQGDHVIAVPGGETSEVKVISLRDRRTIVSLQPPKDHKPLGMPMCLKFVNEQRVLVGYEDGSLALWDISASSIVGESRIHQEPVMCLEYCDSSQQGVSGSSTDQLIKWTITPQGDLSIDRTVNLTNPGLASLALRGDDKILASGGWDSRIRVWGWKKLKALAVLSYHTETVNTLAYSLPSEGSSHLLAAGGKDSHISVWSIYSDPKT